MSPKMDYLSPPSPTTRRPRKQQYSRQAAPGSLNLPSLPRFHPANFPSQSNSASNTPLTGPNSPQPPLSPRAQQRQYSEAQRQLYQYQRQLIASGANPGLHLGAKPDSPKLAPLGSPGPVTPLELEKEGGYLMSGVPTPPGQMNDAKQREIVEKLIAEEAKRQGDGRAQRPTSVGGR